MHGLLLRAVQCFIVDTYGVEKWLDVTRKAEIDVVEFEAMLTYDASTLPQVVSAAAHILGRDEADLKEDLGTYLVSNTNMQSLRRLLRFGGENYVDFLHSLNDLQDRARLAVADLELPSIRVDDHDLQNLTLRCEGEIKGFGHVMIGVLRAMADDYGTLVLLDHQGTNGTVETLSISVIDAMFAEGRSFQLGMNAHD